jgi:amidase
MPSSDVLSLTALEQAALLRAGQLSSVELVRATLARIDALQPRLHAFASVWHERALADAARKDRALRSGGPLPTFHGVPMGIKDLNVVRWSRTRMGSRGVPPFVSPVDDLTVRALRRSGFVFVGKTTTSELGAMPVTEPDTHPPTRNPWQLEHSAGGSSGGAGAAVAARMLALAQGSDGGGSIRLPSAFCHLFGFKPSRGRVPDAYGQDDRDLLYTTGPLATSVDDAAAMVDVLAGLDGGAPHWAPSPPRSYREAAQRPPPRLSIRVVTRAPIGETDPELAAAVHSAARVLEGLGHDVAPGAFPDGSLEEFLPVWQGFLAGIPFVRWSRTQPITRWLADGARSHPRGFAITRRRELEARFLAVFDTADVWLTPTTPTTAPRVGAFTGRPASEAFTAAAVLGAFTAPINVTGQPAASVPLGLSAAGLPMGLQVIGRRFADDVVLQVARQLEQALPWRQRVAPLD